MLRIFGQTDTSFSSNGDKILLPSYANVHKEDGGDYYLDIECGIEYSSFITNGRIITAPTPSGVEPFRIASPTKTRKRIKFKAWHISRDLKNHTISARTLNSMTCAACLANIAEYADPQTHFAFSSDISGTRLVEITNGSVWDAVNKLCEAFGGHIVCDGMNVAINSSIDRDNGVVVRYGKNLRDISVEENWDNVVTVLYPIGKDGLMPGAVTANTPQRASYPIPYTKYVEFRQDISRSDYDSDEAYQSALTADLRAQAQEYVNVHQFPEVTYTVGAALEKLSDVGERVVVIDERMGLTLDTRVISYDYNCLIGKVTETKFGTLPPKLSAVMSQINSLSSRVNAIGG